MSDLTLDVGQANELKLALRRFDWDNESIKRMCEGDFLGDVLDLLRGDKMLVSRRRIVNCSAQPVLEGGSVIVRHVRQGKLDMKDLKLKLLLPNDVGAPTLESLDPRRMVPRYLKGFKMPNIILRDYLVENPHLIPVDWSTSRPVLFWGTVFREAPPMGRLLVPGIEKTFGKWEPYDRWVRELDNPSDYYNPFVVFA